MLPMSNSIYGGRVMLTVENEASLEASLLTDINLFVGAGFSVLAKDRHGVELPLGTKLVAELCNSFNEPSLAGQILPLVSQVIKSKDRIRFNEFLVDRFKVDDYDPRYRCILDLGISRIFTTNIDDLLHSVFEASDGKYLNDLIVQGASYGDKSAVEYLPLHGSVVYPDPDFTFTPIEIASAFASNPTQFQYLVSSIKKSPTLFLGYSLQDAGTLQSLNYTFTVGPQEKARWIQLREADTAGEAYFRSLGFNIVTGDTGSFLDYLTKLAAKKQSPAKTNLAPSDFGSGRIPTLREAPVRPITDYFKGHAPTWHDILTNRIPKTSKYAELINHIDAGRNVLLGGIPVSGKSTLLMQAAAYYDTSKVKLFEDFITPEKARAIVNTVSNRGEVIIFVDGVGDSIDALDILTKSKFVQVVGSDRSVNIGFGSHRFNTSRFAPMDCSDLAAADYSKIFESIPPAIRHSRMNMPKIEAGYSPSTFEFIEKNVRGQTISDRYKEVLGNIRQNQIEIHDLFVMISYVFNCHSPVSFDVVSRFLRTGGNYKDVFAAIDRLGKLLSDIDT